MTADRRRKRGIRARMAQTGEAYSVAARALAADAPRPGIDHSGHDHTATDAAVRECEEDPWFDAWPDGAV